LMAKIIKCIFDDMSGARAEAHDIVSDLKEQWEHATIVGGLVGNVVDADIMVTYMEHKLKHHPSVSSKMVQVLLLTFLKQSKGTMDLEMGKLKAAVEWNKETVKIHMAWIDQITSKIK
jgi:vesicle coat complex subunit